MRPASNGSSNSNLLPKEAGSCWARRPETGMPLNPVEDFTTKTQRHKEGEEFRSILSAWCSWCLGGSMSSLGTPFSLPCAVASVYNLTDSKR